VGVVVEGVGLVVVGRVVGRGGEGWVRVGGLEVGF